MRLVARASSHTLWTRPSPHLEDSFAGTKGNQTITFLGTKCYGEKPSLGDALPVPSTTEGYPFSAPNPNHMDGPSV